MRAVTAIIQLDLRGILRDNVMYINVSISAVTVAVITVLGWNQDRLPGWAEWYPLMIALSLVSGPGGFGYLFGLLMVDEKDSGVRDMLSVTPVRPTTLILTRTAVATVWLCLWPVVTLSIMNSAWQVVDLPVIQWGALVLSLALLTPVLALAIPTLAADKVEALAVFKGLSFVTLAPLAMYFIDSDAWYRYLFLLSPTGWAVQAFDQFLLSNVMGFYWAAGGAVYALALLALAIVIFRRSVYRLSA